MLVARSGRACRRPRRTRRGGTMSKFLIAGMFMVLSATAGAGETGIINQAGPYEATSRFYLHPAHGVPGTAESTEQGGSVADAKEKPRAQTSREPEKRQPAASQASSTAPDRPRQIATRDPK